MSKSWNTSDADWLHIPQADELPMSEFLEPLGLGTAALAEAFTIESMRLQLMIDGSDHVDADLDLRLSRYFRMSEGFFLRLQDQFDIREAKHKLNGDLERIVPRAA